MSMTVRSILLSAATMVSLAPIVMASEPQPRSIEIFTTSTRPVSANVVEGVAVYYLDGLQQLEASLGDQLPVDPEAAKAVALQRLAALEEDLSTLVENATDGLALAKDYGLQKLPAIVFDDGQSVVYGVPDLDQALAIYREKAGQ